MPIVEITLIEGRSREAKARLCRLETSAAVVDGLTALWSGEHERLAA